MVYATPWGTPFCEVCSIATLFITGLVAPYIQLTPVFAREVLGVGPVLLGLMSGMDGFGALLGSMMLASRDNVRRLGLIFLVGALTHAFIIVMFSLSTVYLLSVVLMFAAGVGLAGFVTMQTSLIISVARPEMRARAMGVLTLAIGGMPLGTFYVGLLANHVGAPMAVALNSLACIVLLAILIVSQPALRRFSL